MIIYPAIDLRRGRCVRLQQGRQDRETVYGDDPVLVAKRWADEGAEWLHVVNLDGAFQEGVGADGPSWSPNLRALKAISKAVAVPVQFGGGLRSWENILLAFELGATRIILGTAALENPELLRQALACYGAERVAVSIDARAGRVVTHGWQKDSAVHVEELGLRMRLLGVERVVYTDVSRDGMLAGANIAASIALAESTGLSVILSGGLATLEEIRRLRREGQGRIEGVIIGQALYVGDILLREAIQAGKEP